VPPRRKSVGEHALTALHRGQTLLRGGWGCVAARSSVLDKTLASMFLHPSSHRWCDGSCSKSPSVGIDAVVHLTLVCGEWRAQSSGSTVQLHLLPTTGVHHLLSPWRTQSAQSIRLGLDDRPWNVKASTGCGQTELCWPWCSSRGTWCHDWRSLLVPSLHLVAARKSGLPWRGVGVAGSFQLWYRSASMGLLGVKDTAAPEVKFLDRCKINCSEGALQVHVRRSRMRVWGAKMIRHRRSPRL